ncbi:MAG: DUF3995 domain-containing protein [Saprospiraceae bacterium]
MAVIFTLTNALIFVLLSGLHFYWMFGGKWALAQALPSSENEGEKLLSPGPMACLAVALGLFGFAFYNVSLGIGFMQDQTPEATKWIIWAITGIFLLRAVGDFRYVGFFKKVKNTAFSKMDTKWYAPLCLYLGLSSTWIGWELLQ